MTDRVARTYCAPVVQAGFDAVCALCMTQEDLPAACSKIRASTAHKQRRKKFRASEQAPFASELDMHIEEHLARFAAHQVSCECTRLQILLTPLYTFRQERGRWNTWANLGHPMHVTRQKSWQQAVFQTCIMATVDAT